ncbi:serine/threonine protein kinase [Blautia producta]|uniref:serine/threonine protein kinase n=1 Tax=Blautia producta TaxID=33035 RepID=UPI0031B574E4
MLKVGSLVDGKYKVLAEIGRGGMSVVWLAINERLNRNVAIKEIRDTGTTHDEILRKSIRMEVDTLKDLAHPGLPMIFDIIVTDDTFLIVMSYVEGESLSERLKKQGAQSQEVVIEWGKQLCDILVYLHTRNQPIIYGDIKPANIMLKPDGKLVLIDFGIAGGYRLNDLSALGTRGYAAPEQYSVGAQIDARTDIYALGVTLYQLLTGENPTKLSSKLKPIRQINPTLSSDLEQIIEKCTKINPDQRFQSALELKNALDTYKEMDRPSLGIHIRNFFSKWKKWRIFGLDREANSIISYATEDMEMICYNAELLMDLHNDMDDSEI